MNKPGAGQVLEQGCSSWREFAGRLSGAAFQADSAAGLSPFLLRGPGWAGLWPGLCCVALEVTAPSPLLRTLRPPGHRVVSGRTFGLSQLAPNPTSALLRLCGLGLVSVFLCIKRGKSSLLAFLGV